MTAFSTSIATIVRSAIRRPLTARELGATAGAAFIGGTAYCAIWCRISYFPMHQGAMPLWLSAWWAATCLIPWLIAFEAVKHLAPRLPTRLTKVATTLAIVIATASLTSVAQRYANVTMIGMHAVSWTTHVANQMQPVILFAVFIGLWATERPSLETSDEQAKAEPLPNLTSAEWIRAAGNYVELKCGDRLLIRRMTMRQAEEATRSAEFIRIHRSAIVRKALIHELRGSQLMLSTGDTLPVGQSYRRSVERSVTSSRHSALQPIQL